MPRWKAALLTAATLVVALSGTVQASHGGPEHRASGRGERDVPPVSSETCAEYVIPTPGTFEDQDPRCVAIQTTSTDTDERFAFDARIGRRSPDAHGHMTYELTVVTVVTVRRSAFAGSIICATQTCAVPLGTTETREDVRVSADVTCLTVMQNRAAIGGLVTRWEGTSPPQRSILFSVTDNTIARQQVAPDHFSSKFSNLVLDTCPPPDADAPITQGDIYVDQG